MENIKNTIQRAMKNIMKEKNISDYNTLMKDVFNDPDVKQFLHDNQKYLSQKSIRHSESKLYEYVQEKNKIKQGKRGLIPGYHPKLILENNLIDITYQPNNETIQNDKNRKIKNNVTLLYMSPDIRKDRFDDFYYDNDHKVEAYTAALNFIENYSNNPKKYNQALYLYGPFGVGKTFLLAAIANRLSKHYKTTLVNFPSFTINIKNSIRNNTVSEKVNNLKKAPILMLDDIGADVMSPWIRDDILGMILEYRMQNKLPTFFSSNMSMKNLEEDHLTIDKQGNEEPIRAKRIMERIKYLAKEYKIEGHNNRNPSK